VPQEAIERVKKWPRRLFLSSASDPFHPVVVKLTEEVLRAALAEGTFVVISTKALATPETVKILSRYPGQVSYTVSLSSLSGDPFDLTSYPVAVYGEGKLLFSE